METNGTQTNSRERNCVECGARIPIERIRALPHAWTCARCSTEVKRTDVEEDAAGTTEDRVDSAESAAWDRTSHR